MMRRLWDWLARDWSLKLAALSLAVLLWAVVKAEELVSVSVTDVPVRVHLRDPHWQLAERPTPATVSVQLTGPVREVLRLSVERPRVVVPVEEVRDSVQVTVLRAGWVQLASGLARTRVDDVQPASVRLVFDPLPRRRAPDTLPAPAADSMPAADSARAPAFTDTTAPPPGPAPRTEQH